MGSESFVLDLVDCIYRAAGDPRLWPAFLQKFSVAVEGTSVALVHCGDGGRQKESLAIGVRIEPQSKRKYRDETHDGVNSCLLHCSRPVASGDVLTSNTICPYRDPARLELYSKFLQPRAVLPRLCGIIFKERSALSMIGLVRANRARPFGKEEARLLRALMPHLQRSLQLHSRIVRLETEADSTEEVLDRLSIGCMIVGADGKVLMLNRQARAILSQNDGLSISPDGLCARRAEEANRLRELIQGAATTVAGTALQRGGVMMVQRPSLRRPFQVMVAPLRHRASLLGPEQPQAAVFVSDPESQPEVERQTLSRLYGLTAAEARLAGILMQGKSLEQAAKEFHVSRNTVRSQIQRIFEKTWTHRQAQLVHLLLSSIVTNHQLD